ncbi:hypothetical protein EWI30_15275 [Enterobacter cloacae]|nr:hypothetical protein EWI30_15275 [Enterobacter cloacae]
MGMFDMVTFRYRMPDGKTGSEYQTKDLDCECAFYEISADGRLLRWARRGIILQNRGIHGHAFSPFPVLDCVYPLIIFHNLTQTLL